MDIRARSHPRTYENYLYTLKTINKAFGSKPPRSTSVPSCARLRKTAHQSQASKLRGIMFQIMRKAQANDLILKDPVELAGKTRHTY